MMLVMLLVAADAKEGAALGSAWQSNFWRLAKLTMRLAALRRE